MRDFILFVCGSLCAVMLLGWLFDGIKNIAYIYNKNNKAKGKKR